MLVHWIWFAHRPGVSDRMKLALMQEFSDPEDIFFADSRLFEGISELTPEAREALSDKNLTPAEETLGYAQREQLHLLTLRDAAYPARLKNITDPPVLLYYKGTLPDLDNTPVIGIVGTRQASAYGLTTAKRMGYQISRCGGIVVSGMAKGIDSMAMEGALTAGSPVVGVLGCGADIVYPLCNRSLFQDTERYGCILSEFAPGTPPARWTFPKRNRIIAGLSSGVLIVEAPEKSGALITARQALDQGRDVFTVPGNIDVPTFAGSNRLLRDGAIAVSSGWDVVSEYEALYPDKIRREVSDSLQPPPESPKRGVKVAQTPRVPENKPLNGENCSKKAIDKAASRPYIDLNAMRPKLSAEEAAIVDALKDGEKLVDSIIAETGMGTGKLLAILTMLELKGVIRRLPGKRVTLKV